MLNLDWQNAHSIHVKLPSNTMCLLLKKIYFHIFLFAVDSPKVIQHPESKSVATGAPTTFTTEASGDDLQFQWRKDCMDLSDDDRYHKTDTDTLHIARVVEGDNKARYQCLVKNDTGKDLSREAVLTVSKLAIDVSD